MKAAIFIVVAELFSLIVRGLYERFMPARGVKPPEMWRVPARPEPQKVRGKQSKGTHRKRKTSKAKR